MTRSFALDTPRSSVGGTQSGSEYFDSEDTDAHAGQGTSPSGAAAMPFGEDAVPFAGDDTIPFGEELMPLGEDASPLVDETDGTTPLGASTYPDTNPLVKGTVG